MSGLAKAYLPELPLGNVPRTAYHQAHGLVRVVAYHGDGRFTVLGRGDKRVTVHRSSLSFRRSRPTAKQTYVNRNQQIGKSLEYGVRQKKTQPGRALEFTGGAAAVAWGAPRLKMVGPAIQHGAKLAQQHGGADAARATVMAADTARAALIAGTRPLEQIRRLKRVNHLVETIPRPLRPAVATVAGALLAAHAIPVRRDEFIPVKER